MYLFKPREESKRRDFLSEMRKIWSETKDASKALAVLQKKHINEGRKLSIFNTKRQAINGRKCKTKIAAHLFCVTVTSATAAPADDAAPQFFVPMSCSKLWVQEYLLVFSE